METDCGRIQHKRRETIHSFITSTSLSSSYALRDLEELQSIQMKYNTGVAFEEIFRGIKQLSVRIS